MYRLEGAEEKTERAQKALTRAGREVVVAACWVAVAGRVLAVAECRVAVIRPRDFWRRHLRSDGIVVLRQCNVGRMGAKQANKGEKWAPDFISCLSQLPERFNSGFGDCGVIGLIRCLSSPRSPNLVTAIAAGACQRSDVRSIGSGPARANISDRAVG